MAFRWLNKQGVESEDGFALQSVGRFDWEYRENGRVWKLDGESIVGGNPGFAFNADWARTVPPADRDRIRQNIKEAMRFMDLTAEFD